MYNVYCVQSKQPLITTDLKPFHEKNKINNIFQVPEETCDLNPQKSCNFVTKLVPKLKPDEECVDTTIEVCSRSKQNPRQVQKPIIKKWCYSENQDENLKKSEYDIDEH